MSKANDLLKVCKDNLNQWTCAYCASNSNQPAATFREIKKQGYQFEEVAPNRWGKNMFCDKCQTIRTHYKLLNLEPQFSQKERISIDPPTRKRIIKLLNCVDAFTGASISSTPEIDHKTPWSRLDNDVNAALLSDDEIILHFQLLTREHNLLKDRICSKCKISGVRLPLFGIPFWYAGNQKYEGTCIGCGWYDGAKWRLELSKKLINEKIAN